MASLESITKNEQREEKDVYCPNCHGVLYPLEGSIEKIVVCRSCGKSFDYKKLMKKHDSFQSKVPMFEIFNNQFMQKYTNFACFDDFLKECPIIIDVNQDSFDESIPLKYPKKWNKYVKRQTIFSSWSEMFEKAIEMHLHI